MYIGTFYSPSERTNKKSHLSVRLGVRKANASSLLTASAVTFTHVIHCLLLVQPMKIGNRPDITENLLTRT